MLELIWYMGIGYCALIVFMIYNMIKDFKDSQKRCNKIQESFRHINWLRCNAILTKWNKAPITYEEYKKNNPII